MRLPKKVRLGLPVAAMGLGAMMMAATPATAIDWDHGPWASTDASPGAKAYFEEHGDRVKICDTDSDSYAALVEVYEGRNDLVERYSIWDSRDDGRCTYADASTDQYSNLRENRWHTFRVCKVRPSDWDTKNCKYYRAVNDH